MCSDAPRPRPINSHISGLLSHNFGSYIYIHSAGLEGGGGCGWFLGGGCQEGGSGSPLSAFSIVLIVVVFIFVVGVVGFVFVSGIGMLSLP
jgi:hypothetical protein